MYGSHICDGLPFGLLATRTGMAWLTRHKSMHGTFLIRLGNGMYFRRSYIGYSIWPSAPAINVRATSLLCGDEHTTRMTLSEKHAESITINHS